MSWLRNSPLRMSFGRRSASISPPKDCDPLACYESFKTHWQQAYDIISRTQGAAGGAGQDDVLGVVNHLEQLLQLLVLELRGGARGVGEEEEHRCLEHLLSQGALERLLNWSNQAGCYSNVLHLEQLKMYEMLLSNSGRHEDLLAHEPFLRPLLALLASCLNEFYPVDLEKRLILLLNQLCVCLMQNSSLLDLFFCPEPGPMRFVIFSLLIRYIHCEGGIGHQARDAMLLCMSLSKKNNTLGLYIAEHSNVCPVLATGLSELYSRLPHKLQVETEDWHRLTPDDVNELPELTLFLNSLEFCNAVVQVAHPLVRAQMLEFLYHGFLVPVMGPALLQDSEAFSIASSDPVVEMNVAEELVASTAYLDLFLRSVTEPGLLHSFLRFLLTNHYDGERILDRMVQRINTKSRLCLVSLAVFDTLIGLHSEDVMLELVFSYLLPCTHIMLSQRRRIRDLDPHCKSAEKLLSLSPACCTSPAVAKHDTSLSIATRRRTGSSASEAGSLTSRKAESLHGNYCAYLCDAHRKITACADACKAWTHRYDGESPDLIEAADKSDQSTKTSDLCSLDSSRNKFQTNDQSYVSLGESSGYESFACREESREPSPDKEMVKTDNFFTLDSATTTSNSLGSSKDAGISLDPSLVHIEGVQSTSKVSSLKSLPKDSSSYLDVFQTTPNIGPFLDVVLRKLEGMMGNSVYVNLQLTGLLSRLAAYPQPLLLSFLLSHSLVFQPSVRSLFQVLGSLKQRIDSYLSRRGHLDELVMDAQAFLVAREERIVNVRRLAQENLTCVVSRRTSNPVETFSRVEPKRKSFSSALSSVFKRATQNAFLPVRENAIEGSSNGYRYRKPKDEAEAARDAELRGVVMCAVLLDEWLKELAALAQEHVACSEEPAEPC